MLLSVSPHDDKAFAVGGDVWEVCEPLEATSKDATFHEVLVRQEVLTDFLHVSSEVLSQETPHVPRIVLRPSRHGVSMLDHLQDGSVRGLVDELQAVRRTQDFLEVRRDLSCSLEGRRVLATE